MHESTIIALFGVDFSDIICKLVYPDTWLGFDSFLSKTNYRVVPLNVQSTSTSEVDVSERKNNTGPNIDLCGRFRGISA